MSPEQWEIEFYEKENGRCPTADFLNDLRGYERVFVNKAIERLRNYGTFLGEPHVKLLKNKIWELRIKVRRVNYRILFFVVPDNQRIVLLQGFKKKASRVDSKEINKAVEYRNKYLGR